MIYNQQEFDIRFEWGLAGIRELAPVSDILIIVDVLSFSTCVDIATTNGALIFPYQWKDETAIDYARAIQANLADTQRKSSGYSLSPSSLITIPSGTRLVLPSPNGSALTLATPAGIPTICGCLRNAKAIAEYAMQSGKKIAIIAAGEKWTDNTLRPAFEDLAGAGAIISHLQGTLSPESKSALSVFKNLNQDITNEIKKCISGKELIDRGFEKDLYLACEIDTSRNVPILQNHPYTGGSVFYKSAS